ncbi:MAG: hypothetical protein MUC49_14960 [Raineya sp.]|nr:hypothetical protein [Raineya sp.]
MQDLHEFTQKEYARMTGTSIQNVNNKIRKGTLRSIERGKETLVCITEEELQAINKLNFESEQKNKPVEESETKTEIWRYNTEELSKYFQSLLVSLNTNNLELRKELEEKDFEIIQKKHNEDIYLKSLEASKERETEYIKALEMITHEKESLEKLLQDLTATQDKMNSTIIEQQETIKTLQNDNLRLQERNNIIEILLAKFEPAKV